MTETQGEQEPNVARDDLRAALADLERRVAELESGGAATETSRWIGRLQSRLDEVEAQAGTDTGRLRLRVGTKASHAFVVFAVVLGMAATVAALVLIGRLYGGG